MSKVGEYYRELREFGINPMDIKPRKKSVKKKAKKKDVKKTKEIRYNTFKKMTDKFTEKMEDIHGSDAHDPYYDDDGIPF